MADGIQIKDYNPGEGPKPGEQTWTTQQLREDFEVLGFSMGIVVARRRSDGVKGSLEFTHNPRLYHGWAEDS